MRRAGVALTVLVAASVLAAACGGGEQPATETAAPGTGTAQQVNVAFTPPAMPMMGENTFEVLVTDQSGSPVTDADVSVELFMPAMPEMNMAEMRTRVPLQHQGEGRYSGAGNVMMAGNWDATVVVTRDGREVGRTTTELTAK